MYPEEVFSDKVVTLLEMDNHLTGSLRNLHQEVEKRRKELDDLCREEQVTVGADWQGIWTRVVRKSCQCRSL